MFDHIPAQSVEDEAVIEAAALDAAAVCGPHRLRQWCVLAAARLDPDGREPNDEVKQLKRGVSVHDRPDGWAKLTGTLTPWAAAVLRAVLGPLSAPDPAADGSRDQRSPAQRLHDGLADACGRLLRAGTLPNSGGATTTVLVTIDYRDLLQRLPDHDHRTGDGATGCATTSYGTFIPVAELLRRASGPRSSPSCSTTPAGCWPTAAPAASPAQRSAARWPPETGAACDPGAPSPPTGARATT